MANSEREAPGGVVPEGWVLVPERPSLPMKDAGAALFKHAWGQPSHDFAHEVWRLMLAAAPSPPAAGQCGGDGAREPVLVVPCGASNPLGTVPDSPRERALREAAAALDRDVVVPGPIHGPDGIRRVRQACREKILALLAAPTEGGADA